MIFRVGGRLAQVFHKTSINPSPHGQIVPLIGETYALHGHSGPSLLLSLLSRDFISEISEIYLQKLRGMACLKQAAKPQQYLMGQLPSQRITPWSVFQTGLDFTGPVSIKVPYTRRPVILKASICRISVCFSTKAVHMEAASDLTADAFLASL